MQQLTAAEAGEYFSHPSQQKWAGIKPEDLKDDGFLYWADGPVCGVFHDMPWPGLVMAHYGVKPEGWGQCVPHARAILKHVWADLSPVRIVGWTPESNRAALAFAKRLGFEIDGRMDLPSGAVIMQGIAL